MVPLAVEGVAVQKFAEETGLTITVATRLRWWTDFLASTTTSSCKRW
ncbi:MAG: hypothetical protein H0V89_03650 [Deltaproteobacteria bacterium]|nr:hypothetical protein [Deltaproteobacteria bacterium]